jgi:restriction system protein
VVRAVTWDTLQQRIQHQASSWEERLPHAIREFASAIKEVNCFEREAGLWPKITAVFEDVYRELGKKKEDRTSTENLTLVTEHLTDGLNRAVGKAVAYLSTADAQAAQSELTALLRECLKTDPAVKWKDLVVDVDPPRPALPRLEEPPTPAPLPAPPMPDWNALWKSHKPPFTILDWFDSVRRESKTALANARLEDDRRRWKEECARVEALNGAAMQAYYAKVSALRSAHSRMVQAFENEWALKVKMRALQNKLILGLEEGYAKGESEAVAAYCEAVLKNAYYPDYLPTDTRLAYTRENGLLVVDYAMPSPKDIPSLTEVKFVQASKKLTEKRLSDTKNAQLYDDVIYQIVLRTLDELFRSDTLGALKSIALNGIVTSRDRATGKEAVACILSIQVSREEFQEIDLANVDPKVCFRKLKGVGSSKLHSITAVAPIVRLQTDDPRLIESHAVGESLDSGSNLAAMDWEEFEHFIREIFEKEFATPGSQVRVTRASRDGGVDAIVFDPDPIRGGKIVIQAKRYTNTVGVAAVRDLYGTVLNEGASKGILVTTSDYGPDSYEFAAGKPLTLLSGSNLLHLLSKHGISAHINLSEAKRLAIESGERPHNA